MAYLRVNVEMTNADYRRLHHGAVETVEATRELRGLVETGLVEMHGTRRWAYYTLSEEVLPRVQPTLPLAMSDEERILAYVEQRGSINNASVVGRRKPARSELFSNQGGLFCAEHH